MTNFITMKTILLSVLLAGSSLLSADKDWKKERPVAGFTGLSVSSGIDVYLTQGNSEKLTFDVKGIEEDEVKSEVRNGSLKLYIDRKGGNGNYSSGRDRSVKAYVTFKQLTDLQAGGGSEVIGQSSLSFNDLNLDASGGSTVTLSLKADQLNASASGGADVKLTGSARSLNASGSSGSDLDARKLTTNTGTVSASSGSTVHVNASQSLTMKASGGSDVYYSGSAKVVSSSKSGGADISRN